jgi:hypothetical protein
MLGESENHASELHHLKGEWCSGVYPKAMSDCLRLEENLGMQIFNSLNHVGFDD